MRRAARSRSSPKKFYPVFSLYLRARFVYSLPLVESFLGVPGLRWLVLWSYSTSARLGAESHVFGLIDDPDLTDIGSGAIIGHGSTLVAHSLTTNPDGTKVMVTAPIVIGPRSVIGGGSLISLGASIGADSVVEPLSSVTAYTKIPPGEVWGGNPAVFRRKRIESCSSSRPVEQPPTFAPAARSDLERQVCSAVASALNLPPQMVTPTFSNRDHSGWDSLGQLAIASELHSFPGCENSHGSVLSVLVRFRDRGLSRRSQSDRRGCDASRSVESFPALEPGTAPAVGSSGGNSASRSK